MSNSTTYLFDCLNRVTEMHPDRIALREAGRAVTYRELRCQVHAFSKHIAEPRQGQTLALFSSNRIEWHVVHLAALQAGIPVWGIDPAAAQTVIENQAALVHPRWIWAAEKYISKISLSGVRQLEPHHFANGENAPYRQPPPDSVVTLVWSSGTTGQPKQLGHTYAQLSQALHLVTQRLAHPGWRSLSWLPLGQLFQRMSDLATLSQGGEVFLCDQPKHVLRDVRRSRATLLIIVPKFADSVAEKIHHAMPLLTGLLVSTNPLFRWLGGRIAAAALRLILGRSVRYLVCGSAPLRQDTEKLFSMSKISLLQAYGTSEIVVPIALSSPDSHRFGSVGTPTEKDSVTIAPDGEILVRSNCLCGYGRREKTDDQGNFHTGDCGYLDANGFLFISGRKADEFKLSNGKMISPLALEVLIESHPLIQTAVVCKRDSESTLAIIALKEKREADHAILRAEIERLLSGQPKYCIPKDLVILPPFTVESGELTGNFKKRRSVIIERYFPRSSTGKAA